MDEQYYRKERPKARAATWLKKQLKKRHILISLLVGVPVVSFVLFSNKGVVKRMSLESEVQAMEAKLRESQQEQQELLEQSKALDNNPKAIEKVAREKYGMIREGETVYKIKKEK